MSLRYTRYALHVARGHAVKALVDVAMDSPRRGVASPAQNTFTLLGLAGTVITVPAAVNGAPVWDSALAANGTVVHLV